VSPSTDSALSVWLVEDDQSNLERVVGVVAAGRRHVDKFDYALVEESAIRGLGIEIQRSPEACPDEEASRRWHHNVIRLTATNLNAIVQLIRSEGRVERVLKPRVEAIIRNGMDSGQINPARLQKSLLDSLS